MGSFSTKVSIVMVVVSVSLRIVSAQWIQSNGPWGGNILSIAACGDTVFAGTSSGLFMSIDHGTNWSVVKNGPPEYVSVPAIETIGDTVYAAVGGTLSRSTDRGSTWTNCTDDYFGYFGMTTLSVDGGFILAGTEDGGAVVSNDNGATWNPSGLNVEHVGATYAINGMQFAASYEGLFRSGDKGVTWEKVKSGPVFSSFTSNERFIFAGSDSGIFRSADTGATWMRLSNGVPDDSLQVLSMASFPSVVFAGCANGDVFRSGDDGSTWTKGDSGFTVSVQSLGSSGSALFAGVYSQGVFISNDTGNHWTSATSGIYNMYFGDCVVAGDTLYVVSNEALFRSTDNGIGWEFIREYRFQKPVWSLTFRGTSIATGVYGEGCLYSADNGATWTMFNDALTGTDFNCLAFSGSTLIAGTQRGMFCSNDKGVTWMEKDLDTANPAVGQLFSSGDSIVMAATSGGIFRSIDNGNSWVRSECGIPSPSVTIYSFTATEGNLFVATYDGIYRSVDNGTNWDTVYSGSNSSYQYLCSSGQTVFVGSYKGGIMFSRDNGEHWIEKGDSLHQALMVYSMEANETTLFARTHGAGIWRRSVDEIVGVKKEKMKREADRNHNTPIRSWGSFRTISFSLLNQEQVAIDLFNLSGRRIATLTSGRFAPGLHEYRLNTAEYPAGCYTVTIRTGASTFVQRVSIVR